MRHVTHVAPRVTFHSVLFRPEIISFILVSVSFILNVNSLNIRDFSKNLVFGVHSTFVASNFVKI